MKAWCVQHREGWCASSAQVRRPDPSFVSVRTKCRHYVTFPWGMHFRTPTCKACKRALLTKGPAR